MSKRITLCADDYGYNDAVSEGILDLLNKGRLNATSCMTNMPGWEDRAKTLKDSNTSAQIGLHLNLTEGNDSIPFRKLLRKCLTGRAPYAEISRRIEPQFKAFYNAFGHAPDFIDGHQHIHQLSGVRSIIIRCYAQYHGSNDCWVRLSANSFNKMLLLPFPQKQILIYLTGYRKLRHLLKTDRIPCNTSFAGVYDFSSHNQYREYFQQFLKHIDDGGLIMCHPGLNGHDKNDEIATSRVSEYRYLNSDLFLKDLAEHQCSLGHK